MKQIIYIILIFISLSINACFQSPYLPSSNDLLKLSTVFTGTIKDEYLSGELISLRETKKYKKTAKYDRGSDCEVAKRNGNVYIFMFQDMLKNNDDFFIFHMDQLIYTDTDSEKARINSFLELLLKVSHKVDNHVLWGVCFEDQECNAVKSCGKTVYINKKFTKFRTKKCPGSKTTDKAKCVNHYCRAI